MNVPFLAILSATLWASTVEAQTTSASVAPVASAKEAARARFSDNPNNKGGEKTQEKVVGDETGAGRARQQLMVDFNMYRDYSITIDTIMSAVTAKGVSDVETTSREQGFSDYVAKIDKILRRKLSKLDNFKALTSQQITEKNTLMRGISILKSAQCLVTKSDGSFEKMVDADGFEIMAFPVDSLKQNSRYGFVDKYKNGFVRVQKDQVFGFLNYCGEEVVQYQYERAEPFNQGKALVKKADWFFVDVAGSESNALEGVADAKALSGGLSWVKMTNGKAAIITNHYDESKQTLSGLYDAIEPFFKHEIFKVSKNGKLGLLDISGSLLTEVIYDRIEPTNFKGVYKVEVNKKFGILDSTFKAVYKPVFDEITAFNESGVARCKEGVNYRFLTQKTLKASRSYDFVSEFNAFGVATVTDEMKKVGLIDANLNVLVPPSYLWIGNFNQFGLANACHSEGHCGVIKTDGSVVIPMEFEEVSAFNKFGMAVAKENPNDCKTNDCKFYTVYDQKGKVLIPKALDVATRYEVTDSLHNEAHIIVMAYQNGAARPRFHLLDRKTFKQITKMPYETISPFDGNGLFRVEKNGLWGLIDIDGRDVVKCQYGDLRMGTEGYYPVRNAETGLYGFIDKKGKVQIPFEYEDVKYFRNGHCVVTKGREEWGLISKFNAKIVPCVFKTVIVKESRYELKDAEGNVYTINDKGDCEQHCAKFETIRKAANMKAANLQTAPAIKKK
jgi:WG containing repeat